MTGTRSVGRLLAASIAALLVVGPAATAIVGAQATAEWNIAMVGGPATGSGTTIAVVDTGVDVDHFAFGGRVLSGIDLVDDDDNADDEQGHGTHVAGIAAGQGIICGGGDPTAIGVAPQVELLPVRVLDENGDGSFDTVNAGIRVAADRGATVINLSLGDAGVPIPGITDSWKADFRAALAYAWGKGSIPVLASGNRNNDLTNILSSGYGNGVKAVVVTAVGDDGSRAAYANSVDRYTWGIAAPGGVGGTGRDGNVLSALPDQQCGHLGGTSMAAPHVAGALAILRARGLSQQAAVDRILDTAADSGNGTGAGLLDLTAALRGTGGGGTTSSSTTTSTSTSTTGATSTTATSTSETTASTTEDEGSTTTEGSTTSSESSTTTETEVEAEAGDPPEMADDEDELADGDMTLDSDASEIPGAAAIAATAAVVLVWFGWVGAVRRRLFS